MATAIGGRRDTVTPLEIEMTDGTWVGAPAGRVDARAKVKGTARYVTDLEVPGMLYAKVLRSPHPHAKIVRIDTSQAQRYPGVVAVVTGEDLPARGGEALRDQSFLAADKVRYVGEPVAAVAAVDPVTAALALEQVEVAYEAIPAVLDPLAAAQDGSPRVHEHLEDYERSPRVRPERGTNVCHRRVIRKGNVENGFAVAEHVFEDVFRTQMIHHVALEPHAVIARVDGEGCVTLWAAHDAPHHLASNLASVLGLAVGQVRVVVSYVGGNFGGKGTLTVEPIAVALAYRTGGRPVRLVYDRDEVFGATVARHAAIVTIKTGVSRDGTMLARRVHVHYDTGAYADKGPAVVNQGAGAAVGPYRIPNVEVIADCVYTNKPVAGAYRGFGTVQVCFAYEMHLERIARSLGLDSMELRLKHAVESGDELPTGAQRLRAVGLRECLQKANAVEGATGKPTPPPWQAGHGVACGYKSMKSPSGSTAVIYFGTSGHVRLLCSTVEVGQGAYTALSQIVGHVLGVPPERIDVSAVDTAVTPFDAATVSSRSTFHMGNAVQQAAADIGRQLIALAAPLLQASEEELELTAGRVQHRDDPARGLPLEAILQKSYRGGFALVGRGSFYSSTASEEGGDVLLAAPSAAWMFGAQGVRLAVDQETGEVRVLQVIAAHDVGRAINPMTCEGQIEGGVVQGLGQALCEEMVFDEVGQLVNGSFLEYRVPVFTDLPDIDPRLVEVPHPDGPLGAKGVGELPMIPTAAAVGAALYRATGAWIPDLPLTPERVYNALTKIGTEGGGSDPKPA